MAALAWSSPLRLPHKTVLCGGDAGNDISSDMSSSEILPSIQLGLVPCLDIGVVRTSHSSAASSPSKQQPRQNRLHSLQSSTLPTAADASTDPTRSSCSQSNSAVGGNSMRKGQGYRKLWQVVSRVQKGERLNESRGCREDVTVSGLPVLLCNSRQCEAATGLVTITKHFFAIVGRRSCKAYSAASSISISG